MLTGPLPLIPLTSGTAGGQQDKGPNVVALGGGHGLSASLSALRLLTTELTAIVTVADDGGSSGRLREEYGVLPPGDLRMALSALCDDTDWGRTWRDVMQHRFRPGKAAAGPSMTTPPATSSLSPSGNCSATPWRASSGPAHCWGRAGRSCRCPPCRSPSRATSASPQPDGESVLQTVSGQARCAVAGSLEQSGSCPNRRPHAPRR